MDVKDIGAYLLYSDGRVFKKSTSRFAGGSRTNTDGYLLVCINGKQKKVHQVIASAFIEKPPSTQKLQVNNINGIKTDNRVENLEWCTQSENCAHAFKIGLKTALTGSLNGHTSITEEQVKDIKINLRDNKGRGILTKMANKYNVTTQCIWLIKEGKTWKHVV